MWLIVAIFLYLKSFGFVWVGAHDPALALRLASMVLRVLFFGWIAAVLLGAWLHGKSKVSRQPTTPSMSEMGMLQHQRSFQISGVKCLHHPSLHIKM
jgi:hypothetical protein